MEWDGANPQPPSCLPAPDPAVRHDLREMLSPCRTRLEVSGPIKALTARALAAGLESLMRRTADAAAVSGAVLEMRVLREVPPRGAPADLVEALAVDLWRAGFGVRFAPCWEPVRADGLVLGVRGDEEGLRGFLGGHPAWKLA